MRKIQVVTDYELYKYEELDSKGKEKAKRKYLDEQDEYEFTDMVEADTTLVFPNSKLKVQYSLSYCQGDGVSVYGKLAFEDIFNILKGNGYPTLVEGIEPFTEKEIKTLRFYASEEGTLNVDINRRYPWISYTEHELGFLGKKCPVCGYRYGTAWIKEDVPQEVIDWLFALPDARTRPAWV